MKAILISIRPKWCAKIMNGEKTIEIRKTMPKCDLPIDVYIYCTKDKKYANLINRGGFLPGMVVAKFTLNKVDKIMIVKTIGVPVRFTRTLPEKDLCIATCLTPYDFDDYLGRKTGYAWHISNLEIFDKPKELSEFNKYGCKQYDNDVCETYGKRGHLYTNCFFHLTKAPQSFCFIEVE